LATALSLVIVGLIPVELAKELCYLPLFSARDELSQSKGYCSLLRGFATEFKNQIKKLGIKSEIYCLHISALAGIRGSTELAPIRLNTNRATISGTLPG